MPSKIKVAIAEDQTIVRDGIIELLHQYTPHKVVVDAENGAELIRKINMLQTPPDVCLIDISMPVLNGYETTEQLSKLYPRMKLLALTMFSNKFSVIRMIKKGVHGFLLKNNPIEIIGNAITTVYTEGNYYSEMACTKIFAAVMQNKLPDFTEKEIDFIGHCCSGLSFEKIAEKMYKSKRTIEKYQESINAKFNIHSRQELELFALRTGLVPIN